MQSAVRAEGLTKHYSVYKRPADRLIELITRRNRHRTFAALEDVSFEVEKGETIGIVGQNGAGKSTLLKLLAGVTEPTRGTLQAQGKIASILELGTGFHPEFTGRDNAALNAAILGLPPDEIRARLPAILDFSELGAFIDQPVKTYSSGMYMRLAFSVAVNIDPDILIIDEALAVGDGHFQKKCIDRIREFQEHGKTILFCSHALYYVTSICRRTLWLDGGRVMAYGPSLDVIHDYEQFLLERDKTHAAPDALPDTRVSPVRFETVEICNRNGESQTVFGRGDDMAVRIRVRADDPTQPVHLLVGVVRTADEMQCFVAGTHQDELPPLVGQTDYEVMLQFSEVPLTRGEYSVIAFVGDEHALTVFDRRDLRPGFSIGGDKWEVGLIAVRHRWDEVRSAAGVLPASR